MRALLLVWLDFAQFVRDGMTDWGKHGVASWRVRIAPNMTPRGLT
jgi:hypothetical protein